MAGLVPEKRSREELSRANESFLKEHRAYFESWKEAITASQRSDRETDHQQAEPKDGTIFR